MSKAIIGISDWDQRMRDLGELARRLDAGEDLPLADYHLDFANAAELLSELPPRRLDTLRAVKRMGPVSIYAVAKALGRNYSNVHADVHKLFELCLVDKEPDGRVVVPWEDIVVQVNASLLGAA